MSIDIHKLVEIARLAGDAIMDVYNSNDFGIENKGGEVPLLTKADKDANNIIVAELKKLSKLPIISEENDVREITNKMFWLVDPLDGTKEFVKRNGEFTVNIALIENDEPVMGVVYAPAIDVTYFGSKDNGSYKITDGIKKPIKAEFHGKVKKVVTSRSHKDEKTVEYLDKLGEYEEVSMGSSLKLCLVAEGDAFVYPRLGPTCLWDTAAADAVVRAAGGSVEDTEGKSLEYIPSKSIKNPFFIVRSKNS